MKSPEQVERIVGQAHLQADQMTDARILSDADEALVESAKSRPAAWRPGPTLWRTIMEKKVTKYSAAAVVMLAAALVLLSPFGTSKSGSIVLADVADNVREMHTVVHKEKYIFWETGKEEPVFEPDVIKYVSEEHGCVEHLFDDQGTLTHEVYFLNETQRFMIVAHAEKVYLDLSLPEDIFNRAKALLTPRGLVEYFTSGQYTELGRARFDNLDVEGFETVDRSVLFPIPEPLRSLFPVKDIVGRIWIDVDSSLPVGVEAEFNTGRGLLTGLKKLRGEFRAYDFQWNAAQSGVRRQR